MVPVGGPGGAVGMPTPQDAPKMVSAWGAKHKRQLGGKKWLPAADSPPSLYVLSARPFGDAEAAELAAELTADTRLEDLYASGHSLGLAGTTALAAAVAAHPALKQLCLGGKEFGADREWYAVAAAAQPDGRWGLRLSAGRRAGEALDALLGGVGASRSLEVLDMESKVRCRSRQ